MHTNSAIGAITRLRDMGIEPFLLSSTLIGVAAQRLVRLLCGQCKRSRLAAPKELALLGFQEKELITLYQPAGCQACGETGYQGRTGIYELIPVDDSLCEYIHDNASETVMTMAVNKTYANMRQDGFRRVLNGETTLEEVLRVTGESAS